MTHMLHTLHLFIHGFWCNKRTKLAMLRESILSLYDLRTILLIIRTSKLHLHMRDRLKDQLRTATLGALDLPASNGNGGSTGETETSLAGTTATHDIWLDVQTDCALVLNDG